MPQIKKVLLAVMEIWVQNDTETHGYAHGHTNTQDQLLDSPLVVSTCGE